MSEAKKDSTLEESNADRARREGSGEHSLVLLTDCSNPLTESRAWSLKGVTSVSIGRGDRQDAVYDSLPSGKILRITLDDRRLSRTHTFLERVGKHWLAKDSNSRNGTLLNGVRIESARLANEDILIAGRSFFMLRTLSDYLPSNTPRLHPSLCTLNSQLHEVFARVAKLASSKVEIVIEGAIGTGKQRTARAIHDISKCSGDFVVLNSGAMPDAQTPGTPLRGSVPNGHKGTTLDLIRLAHKGTLFIDEVADLSQESQSMLLRILQDSELDQVGTEDSERIEFRLICATRHCLEERVKEGHFRDDLCAQIRGYTASLPPLHAHREDLGLLIAALLPEQAEGANNQTFTIEAMLAILRHGWPRNIRELEKALAVAAVLADGDKIELGHLPEAVVQSGASATMGRSLDRGERERKAELERLLTRNAGNVSAVAREFGKGRTQIVRWIARYNLDADSYRA